MILKIEGTDREIITLFEGLMELMGSDMTQVGTDDHGKDNKGKPLSTAAFMPFHISPDGAGPLGPTFDCGFDGLNGADGGDTPAPEARKDAGQKTSAPRNTREITIQEIKDEVPLEKCGSIPEAIEAIQLICKTGGSALARAMGLDPFNISTAKNGKVYPATRKAFVKHFPELKLKDPAEKKPGKAKLNLSYKAPKKTPKPPKHILAGDGSKVSIEKLLKVDLNSCADIPAVINKLQLKTNITGTHLAELLGIHASDLSKARKGVIPPFVERAFKQHLQFPAVADSLNLNP